MPNLHNQKVLNQSIESVQVFSEDLEHFPFYPVEKTSFYYLEDLLHNKATLTVLNQSRQEILYRSLA